MTDRKEIRDSPPSADDVRLLRAATYFADADDVDDLLEALKQAVPDQDGFRIGGFGVYQERRKILIVYAIPGVAHIDNVEHPEPFSAQGEEFPLLETEAADFITRASTHVSPRLESGRGTQLQQRFNRVGIQRYVSVPLVYGDQFVGALYAFSGAEADPNADTLAFFERLGQLLTPVLWNQLTRSRLALGDRRRATLIELSDAINKSLELEPILNTARHAVGRIEGHRVSIVGLLDENGKTLRAYWHPPQRSGRPEEPGKPEVLPVASTPLPWVLEHRQTFESEELEEQNFRIDEAIRRAGARRYVVAPMFVRGKIIGGFFFGTTDPHPALTTDVWLYENIALQLALAIDNARQFEQLKRFSDRLALENVYLREEIETDHNIAGIIGRSSAMLRVFDAISRVAETDAAVLISGPTGVGKELVARAIHAQSGRAKKPLVKVNCAAIPENLVESELFGHEKGAFTSAVAKRIGRFELAHDGTLFLDEVGELPLSIQAKLLRVLQDGEFERVGGAETITTNARLMAATNRDLLRAIENGSFRSDLFYRLNVFPIEVPPLSERREDIPLLVEAFISQLNRRMGKEVESIHPNALQYLRDRPWPGNVRELQHVIERAMILCDGPRLVIEPSDPASVHRPPSAPPTPALHTTPAVSAAPRAPVSTMKDMEREHITGALQQAGGVIDGPRGAAVLLGLKPSTLRSRMKRLGINRRPFEVER